MRLVLWKDTFGTRTYEKIEVFMPDARFAWGVQRNLYAGLRAREIRNDKFPMSEREIRYEKFGYKNYASCRVYAGLCAARNSRSLRRMCALRLDSLDILMPGLAREKFGTRNSHAGLMPGRAAKYSERAIRDFMLSCCVRLQIYCSDISIP